MHKQMNKQINKTGNKLTNKQIVLKTKSQGKLVNQRHRIVLMKKSL